MRTATDVELRNVILHWARPRLGKKMPELSELALAVDALPPEVAGFLVRHLGGVLADTAARAANFEPQQTGQVSGLVGDLLPDDDLIGDVEFVQASRGIVEALFGVMAADGRINDGTIVVARFSVRIDGRTDTYVAVLKLDPSDQYRAEMHTHEGKARLEFEVVSGILPSRQERLHKAAVFRRFDEAAEYQFLVIDRQVGDVADWFVERFLGAALARTDQERTKGSIRGVTIGIQRLEEEFEIDAETSSELAEARDAAMQNHTVDVEDWVDNRVRLEDSERALLRSEIAKKVPDRRFTVSLDDARPATTTFVGSDGLRVSILTEALNKVTADRDDSGTWTVSIETRDWRRR